MANMNTDLAAVVATDITLHAGRHAKHIPAGTVLLVRSEAVESGAPCVYVRVARHPRISGTVYALALIPA